MVECNYNIDPTIKPKIKDLHKEMILNLPIQMYLLCSTMERYLYKGVSKEFVAEQPQNGRGGGLSSVSANSQWRPLCRNLIQGLGLMEPILST